MIGSTTAIFTSFPETSVSQAEQLRSMAQQTSRAPAKLAAEFARLSFGPGKLSFSDYVEFRLYDDDFVQGADKSLFAGRSANSQLINDINFDRDAFILTNNKLAGAAFLRSYGFRTPETRAVYVRGHMSKDATVLGDSHALAGHLRNNAIFPLFGKPVDGDQSLGSIVIQDGVAEDGQLTLSQGLRLTPESLASQIDQNYPSGYLLQAALAPPSEISRVTGGALGTLRLVTVLEDGEGHVIRACLKLPANGNIADNYWRRGNLLAQIDMASGAILSVTSGVGLGLRVIDLKNEHDGLLSDYRIPSWREYLEVAEQAQTLLTGLPLIGWDIGVTHTGPVIVELNAAPNNLLVQLADRRGLIEPIISRLAISGRRGRRELASRSRRDLSRFVSHRR